MAYFSVGDPEAVVECPYDNTHMVRNKRMQYHLIDCRKNHASKDMKVCPYNAKHVHPAAEHQYHLVHCPDRVIVDRDIIYASEEQYECVPGQPKCYVDVPPYTSGSTDTVTEDWDQEACGEHFSFTDIISFPRPKSEPIITAAAPPMPVMRQPRYDPDVLGRGGTEVVVGDGMLESRRQPRASNASVSSLTVSRQVQPVRDNNVSQALPVGRQVQPVRGNPVPQAPPAVVAGEKSVATATYGRGQPANNGGTQQQEAVLGRGRAVYLSVMASADARRVGRSSATGSVSTSVNAEAVSHATEQAALSADLAAVSGTAELFSQPLDTTVYGQHEQRKKTATVTPAFVLPGLGRGAMSVQPPSASSLPLPVFSKR